jgi:predicted short-subunit dehydrogenase-like oxidoreductase (DUF2520 family)
MNQVSIIGAGRLGTSLASALRKKGYSIKALSCRTISSAKESQKIIGEGKALTGNVRAARLGNLIFLCLPDEEIEKVAAQLASSDIDWSKKLVFHCSGLLPSKILKRLKDKGALTASFHPVQSFARKKTDPADLKNIYFGLEGCDQALASARKIVHKLGGHPFILKAKDKAIYHSACSIASNFLIVLLDTAVSLLKRTGLNEERAFQILLPLVQGTLHNVKKFNMGKSLTGPVIRGDRRTVISHLRALRAFPSYSGTYRKLAEQALEIARREKRLSTQKIRAMKDLLEER